MFVSAFVLTHVRVCRTDAGHRVELWEQPMPARRWLRLAERIVTLGRLPAVPAADAGARVVAGAVVSRGVVSRES